MEYFLGRKSYLRIDDSGQKKKSIKYSITGTMRKIKAHYYLCNKRLECNSKDRNLGKFDHIITTHDLN